MTALDFRDRDRGGIAVLALCLDARGNKVLVRNTPDIPNAVNDFGVVR
jgi:hypothetical protein